MISRVNVDIDLTGVIDMHIHSSPDVQPRYGDDVTVVQEAKAAGMRAVLLKSHATLTADRATIAERVVGGIRVFGGLALNVHVGGLNPAAVEVALTMGAKEIWMPTRSAARTQAGQENGPGLCILDSEGALRPEIYAILDLIAAVDAILGTGHISPHETVVLVKAAHACGLRKILVTHPEAPFIRMPVETQAEIALEGVYFERCYVDTTPAMNSAIHFAEIAASIRRLGMESTVLSTDFGQVSNSSPVQGMRACLAEAAAEGFTKGEISRMVVKNPRYLLNL